MRPTRAEIDLSALSFNIKQIMKYLSPSTQLMGVVKANAYGHGAAEISRKALSSGVSSLAVAFIEEAIELREANIAAPLLVLGLFLPEQADLFVKYHVTATVCSTEHLTALSAAAKKYNRHAKVMLKIDTGMSRIGIRWDHAPNFIAEILKTPGIELQGAFTHLATADAADKTFANLQIKRYNHCLTTLHKQGIQLPITSLANSATIMDFKTSYSIARAGIIMYGLSPSDEMHNTIDLKPIMQLKSKVIYIKQVDKDTPVSYGCTYNTVNPTYIATIPVGYADGYSRHLSNKAHVLIGGKRYPVVGKICMDQLMVDLGPNTDVKIGDDVVLFGSQLNEQITVTELARLAGTINYELLCDINPRVPRIYIDSVNKP